MATKDKNTERLLDDRFEEKTDEMNTNIVTLTDEEGNSADFEFLGEVEYLNDNFLFLLPDYEDEDSEEVLILEIHFDEEEGESYSTIEDPELITKVFEIFKEENGDLYDFAEDEVEEIEIVEDLILEETEEAD